MSERIVKVSFPAWAESPSSWKLLTKRSPDGKAWSGSSWFPKKSCELIESKHERGVGILTLPEWLFNIKQEEDDVEFTDLQNKII